VICGIIDLAQHAVTGLQSPIYVYVTSARPSSPVCIIPGLSYCPRYSFHLYDLFTADIDWDDWEFTEYEMAVSNLIMERFVELATDGVVMDWLEFDAAADYPETYYTVDLNVPESMQENTRVKKCEFWKQNGFSKFYWQN
jgi:hypothetical protein